MICLGVHCRLLLASLLVMGGVLGLSPAGWSQEIRWFELLRPPEASVGMEMQGTHQNSHVNGVDSTYDQLSLTPLVGLQAQGYVYHPNLLTFDLNGDIGWGWDTMKTTSPGYSQTIRESDELLRYVAQLNFLSAKPYNASFVAAQDHTYTDYGPFNTFTVDSTRYSGAVNWDTGHFTLNADMGYRDDKSTGLTDYSEVTETYFNLNGIDRRQSGETTFTYRVNQFDNSVNSGTAQSSLSQSVGVSDSETFGGRKQIVATTGAGYSQSDYSGQRLQTVTATENINVKHRPNLDSFFTMDFSHNELQPVSDSNVQGMYGIRHQLYESLSSQLDVHGNYQDYSGSGSSSTDDRYGLGLSENYNKRLGSWGQLSLGAGIVADHQDQNSSGTVLTTIDEPHVVYTALSPVVCLNHPNVIISSVVVHGPGGISTALNVDYALNQVGDLIQIWVIPTSAVLHNGDAVTVTYNSDSLFTASFDSFDTSAQIRLELLGKFGIYGRLNWLDNNAPPQVVTQTLTDLAGGADYAWRWFRAGAEYENYDSNFSQYQAWRFLQNFNFQPTAASTLSVNLNQSFYRYPENGDQDQYQFLTRYNIQFFSSLAWFVEGGCNIQNISGSDELMGSARTGLTWSRGKLSVRTGYEFNSQSTSTTGQPTQEYVTSRYYLYLKRTF